jgi:hypothetical protein
MNHDVDVHEKKINSNKFIDVWREFVASSSLNSITQIEDYVLQIQRIILSSIESTISWTRFSFEIKFFWNEKCAKTVTTTRRRRRKWSTLHIEKIWHNYLRALNEKKRIISKEKKSSSKRRFASYAIRRRIFNV